MNTLPIPKGNNEFSEQRSTSRGLLYAKINSTRALQLQNDFSTASLTHKFSEGTRNPTTQRNSRLIAEMLFPQGSATPGKVNRRVWSEREEGLDASIEAAADLYKSLNALKNRRKRWILQRSNKDNSPQLRVILASTSRNRIHSLGCPGKRLPNRWFLD